MIILAYIKHIIVDVHESDVCSHAPRIVQLTGNQHFGAAAAAAVLAKAVSIMIVTSSLHSVMIERSWYLVQKYLTPAER
jgi:hypothetical protein